MTLSFLGTRILDEVLNPLLHELADDAGGVALDGLQQVMAVKSRVVLPHIVPQLIAPPVNPKALAVLCAVAGEHREMWLLVCGIAHLINESL